VTVCLRSCKTTPRRPLQKTLLHEEGLVHFLDGSFIFSNCSRDCLNANRPALEFLDDRLEDPRVHVIETELVYIEKPKRLACNVTRDCTAGLDLRIIANSAKQSIRNTRRAARSACDLLGALVIDFNFQNL
jgi:hypothetical protein